MERELGTNIDRNEFEETILCEDGDDDLVSCLRVVVKKGQSTGVCLDQESACVVETGIGVLSEQWGLGDAEFSLDF